MSEKTITFRYHDEIKQVKVPNYKKCKNAFQREFSISDEKIKKLSLFYYDEEGDRAGSTTTMITTYFGVQIVMKSTRQMIIMKKKNRNQ